MTRFIPLNPTDLEEWMADPEEWVNAEEKENDQWEYELRVSLPFSFEVLVCSHPIALRRACPYDPRGTISSIRSPTHRNDVQ